MNKSHRIFISFIATLLTLGTLVIGASKAAAATSVVTDANDISQQEFDYRYHNG